MTKVAVDVDMGSRVTRIEQHGVTGGNAVYEKRTAGLENDIGGRTCPKK